MGSRSLVTAACVDVLGGPQKAKRLHFHFAQTVSHKRIHTKVFCPLFPNYFLISKITAIERQNRSSSYPVLVQFGGGGVGSLVDWDLIKRLSESGPKYEKKSFECSRTLKGKICLGASIATSPCGPPQNTHSILVPQVGACANYVVSIKYLLRFRTKPKCSSAVQADTSRQNSTDLDRNCRI